MASRFSKLFREYYAIHDTVSRIVLVRGGEPLDECEIEKLVKAWHPGLRIEPATIKAAIRQALKDTEGTVGRPVLSDRARHAMH
jgi:hypothetical protein